MSIKAEGRYKQAMCPVVYNELLMIAFSSLRPVIIIIIILVANAEVTSEPEWKENGISLSTLKHVLQC